MKIFKYIILFFLVFFTYESFSQFLNLSGKNGYVSLEYRQESTGSYFDKDGDEHFSFFDSTAQEDKIREYTFEYNKNVFALKGGYNLTDKITVTGELPLGFYSLKETFTTDTLMRNDTVIPLNSFLREELSLTQLQYFELGSRYYFFKGRNYLRAEGAFRLPLTKEPEGKENELTDERPFEIIAGAKGGMYLGSIYLEGQGNYTYRAEDFSDFMFLRSTLGFTSVENTMIKVNVLYHKSFESFDDFDPLDIRKTIRQKDFFAVGLGFWINVEEKFYVDLNYNVKLFGKYTLNTGFLSINAGLNL